MGVNPIFFVRCSLGEVLKGLNDQLQEKIFRALASRWKEITLFQTRIKHTSP